MTVGQTTDRSVEKLQSIFQDEGGRGKMRNADLQEKTAAVQKEFEQLMSEMVNRRQGGMGATVDPIHSMDDILDGYYMPGPERKHKSPTRRLI